MTTARKENESFEEYKARQKADTIAVKALKHGVLFWDTQYAGTYVNHDKRAKRAAKKQAQQ